MTRVWRDVRVLRLTPWRRAWRLLWGFPSVWGALLTVGAVFALTVALPPLYLGTTASASLTGQIATRCPWLVGLQGRGIEQVPGGLPSDSPAPAVAEFLLGPTGKAVLSADGQRGHLGPPVVSIVQSATIAGRPGRDDEPTTVVFRTAGQNHLQVTGRVSGDGLLLTDRVAAALQVRPGGTAAIRTLAGSIVEVPVVGTYRDLADGPVLPYWCSLDRSIHVQDAFANFVPPPVAMTTSAAVALRISRATSPLPELDVVAERPLDPGLRIDEGEQALAVVRAAQASAERSGPGESHVGLRSELPYLVIRAHAVRQAVLPPILGLAALAGLAALGLVGVVGGFWAERRRTELALLSARGVGPLALAGKAGLEAALPLLVGAGVGTGLAVLLVDAVGPPGGLPPGALRIALELLPIGWAVATAVLTVAVLRRQIPVRAKPRRSSLPAVADVVLLLVAATALARLSPLQLASDANALPSFGLARLIVPLAVLLLVARLTARLLTAVLGRVRGRGDQWPVAVLLAVQRLAGLPRVATALLVTVAVATGTCLYATGLADSLQRTVQAKAEVFVGGQAHLELIGRQPIPDVAGADAFTPVLLLPQPALGERDGTPVTVLAIDPTSFARGAAWDPAYADVPLKRLLALLSAPVTDGRIPALAVGAVPDTADVALDLNDPVTVAVQVRARPAAFPGLRGQPLVVVSFDALDRAAINGATEQLWTRGALQPATDRLVAAGLRVRSSLDVATVSATPSLEAVLQTLDVLRGLGLLVAVLAALGLIVYVDVRARQRRLAAALTRRMGLSARTDGLASWLELGIATGLGLVAGAVTGLGLVAYVSARLDPVPLVAPGPLVVEPYGTALAFAAASVLVTGLTALVGLRGARPDAEVLRAG